jgi:hypothetical protein
MSTFGLTECKFLHDLRFVKSGGSCGVTVFYNPAKVMLSTDNGFNHYETSYSKIAKELRHSGLIGGVHGLGRQAQRRVIQAAGICPGDRVVDFGCGEAQFALNISAFTCLPVIAIDLTPVIR